MNVDQLEEFAGMTPQLVREYLERKGWKHHYQIDPKRACWRGPEGPRWQVTLSEVRDEMGATVVHVAGLEGRSVQALLREMNPRMKVGTPSIDAIRAHGGPWLVQAQGMYPHVSDACFVLMKANECKGAFGAWPCDALGQRVPWPKDANGMDV